MATLNFYSSIFFFSILVTFITIGSQVRSHNNSTQCSVACCHSNLFHQCRKFHIIVTEYSHQSDLMGLKMKTLHTNAIHKISKPLDIANVDIFMSSLASCQEVYPVIHYHLCKFICFPMSCLQHYGYQGDDIRHGP